MGDPVSPPRTVTRSSAAIAGSPPEKRTTESDWPELPSSTVCPAPAPRTTTGLPRKLIGPAYVPAATSTIRIAFAGAASIAAWIVP